MGGGQAVAVTVPAASQAVGAFFSSGRQQRPLRGTGASPAWASLPPRPDTTARRMASPLGLNHPGGNGVTIASGYKPVQYHTGRSFGGGGKGGVPARKGKGKGKAATAPLLPGKSTTAGPLTRQSPQGSPSPPQPRPSQPTRVVKGWCQECGWRHWEGTPSNVCLQKGCPSPHLVLTTLEPATFQPIIVSTVAVAEEVEATEGVLVQSRELEAKRTQLPLADGPFANEDREKSRPVVYDWEERTLPDLGRQDVEDPTALTPFRTFPERLSA